jgi:hypothetical protein
MNTIRAQVPGKNFRLGRVACPRLVVRVVYCWSGGKPPFPNEIFLTLLPGQTDQRIRLPIRGHALKDQDA